MIRALIPMVLLLASSAAGQTPQWAVAIFPSGTEFSLEIAASPAERARGYMFREEIGPREGMLFVFDANERHSIWMKNCLVSLDIIWLDAEFRVLEIARDQPPCPKQGACPGFGPLRPSRYVLEVAGGVAAREGLKASDRLEILAEPELP